MKDRNMRGDRTSEVKRQRKGIDQRERAGLKQSKSERAMITISAKRIVGKEVTGSRGGRIKGKARGKRYNPPMQSLMGWPSSRGCWWEVSGWIDPFSSAGTKLLSCWERLAEGWRRTWRTAAPRTGVPVRTREREMEETERGPKRETRRAGGVIGISLVMQFDHAECWGGEHAEIVTPELQRICMKVWFWRWK